MYAIYIRLVSTLRDSYWVVRQSSAWFLQGVSKALLCKPCISYDRDVRPSVRHTLTLCENDASLDHEIFTVG